MYFFNRFYKNYKFTAQIEYRVNSFQSEKSYFLFFSVQHYNENKSQSLFIKQLNNFEYDR